MMDVGDIGIVDYPYSDAGVIVKIEKVTASRALVSYYGMDGEWGKSAVRKLRFWIPINDSTNLASKRDNLVEAFKKRNKAIADIKKDFEAEMTVIATGTNSQRENLSENPA